MTRKRLFLCGFCNTCCQKPYNGKTYKFASSSYSNRCSRRASSTKEQLGLVMTEYVLATLLIGIVLFTPIPGVDESAFTFIVNALRAYQANATYLMSLP